MIFNRMGGARRRKNRNGGAEQEDRISRLPDDLIHLILSLMGNTKFAVQTSLLSTRWKNLWKSLPHLHFDRGGFRGKVDFSKFVNRIFSRRNPSSRISTINFRSSWAFEEPVFNQILRYAFSHVIQHLDITNCLWPHRRRSKGCDRIPLSKFCSRSLKELTLRLVYGPILEVCTGPLAVGFMPSPWNLPNLTTLYLNRVQFNFSCNGCDKGNCKSADLFSSLVNLKDLTLSYCDYLELDALNIISVNLKHLTVYTDTRMHVVSTSNLTSLTYKGGSPQLLSATKQLNSLREAKIEPGELAGLEYKTVVEQMHEMLCLVRNASFLTISYKTIRILSGAAELLENRASPLDNLKCLLIIADYDSPVISKDMFTYFLNSSPDASIELISWNGERTKLQNF